MKENQAENLINQNLKAFGVSVLNMLDARITGEMSGFDIIDIIQELRVELDPNEKAKIILDK